MVPDTVHSAVGHVIVDAAFVVVAVLNIDDVVKETSKVDLRFLVMDVEFRRGGVAQTHFGVKPNSVE